MFLISNGLYLILYRTHVNYIISMKLKHAATLLIQNKDISITEVCDRCGFNSPAYFSKCFKAQYSVAPMDYRKKHNDASADKQD